MYNTTIHSWLGAIHGRFRVVPTRTTTPEGSGSPEKLFQIQLYNACMKRNIYFYGDPHFGHDNIIKYCDRPFQNSQEMDEALIKNYNQFVRKEDIVYFLGDLGLPGAPRLQEIISRLNGIKILIMGNHDKYGITTYYDLGFVNVVESAIISVGQRQIRLNHYPQRTIRELCRIFLLYIKKMREKNRTFQQVFQRIKREWSKYQYSTKGWNICGHVHNAWKINKKNINVGVDVWDFRPVLLKKVISIIDKEENK